jgi:hypothetical protein
MPRVFHTKAAKDWPDIGVQKGEMYYRWRIKMSRGGIDCRSKTYPRPSQLNRGFRGQLGDIELDMGNAQDPDELRGFAETLRELGEECGSSFENMPEGLQQGDTGQLLEERRDGLEAWADEVEGFADEWQEKLDALGELREAWGTYNEERSNWEGEEPDEEGDPGAHADWEAAEPEAPDGDEPDDDTEGELRSDYVEQATSANPGL